MNQLSPVIACMFAALLAAGCGASSRSTPESGVGGTEDNAGNGGSGGAGAAGGNAASGGGGNAGTGGGTGGTLNTGGSGGAALGGEAGTGSSTGGASGTGGDGAGGGTAGSSGSDAGNAGASGEGGAGERPIACTGAELYFPEFDRTCTTSDDCSVVAHQTNCCGGQLAMGISVSEHAAFAAAEAICAQQYPPCGCAAFGVNVEDGTLVDFPWTDHVEATCDAGTCRAHYTGTSFACGTQRCTEVQYCLVSSGGPVGTATTYSCNPTACTECSCITMPDCTCSDTDGQLTVTCQRA